MTPNAVILALFIVVNILLVALLRWRPQVTAAVGGKALEGGHGVTVAELK